MSGPLLTDTVALRHFAEIERLDILCAVLRRARAPYWTQEVREEITRAADQGQPGCRELLKTAWIGEPIQPENTDLRGIYTLQVALSNGREPPKAHAGEAESIYFAAKLQGRFVTDDNAAFAFAARRLGVERTLDTVDLLREAVSLGKLDDAEARKTADAIRDRGRFLRRVHPPSFPGGYFNR